MKFTISKKEIETVISSFKKIKLPKSRNVSQYTNLVSFELKSNSIEIGFVNDRFNCVYKVEYNFIINKPDLKQNKIWITLADLISIGANIDEDYIQFSTNEDNSKLFFLCSGNQQLSVPIEQNFYMEDKTEQFDMSQTCLANDLIRAIQNVNHFADEEDKIRGGVLFQLNSTQLVLFGFKVFKAGSSSVDVLPNTNSNMEESLTCVSRKGFKKFVDLLKLHKNSFVKIQLNEKKTLIRFTFDEIVVDVSSSDDKARLLKDIFDKSFKEMFSKDNSILISNVKPLIRDINVSSKEMTSLNGSKEKTIYLNDYLLKNLAKRDTSFTFSEPKTKLSSSFNSVILQELLKTLEPNKPVKMNISSDGRGTISVEDEHTQFFLAQLFEHKED